MILKSLNIYSSANDNYSEDCNINSIIEDCLLILKNKINVKTKIVKELQQGMSIVRGNNSELHQAILNLLSNAIDFIEDKGMIKITTKTKEDSCLIIIEDNGRGISKDNLKKILDPFFTTKSPSEGTGLGLSIVHSIIKKHRGLLNFDSELGKGTKIEVSLPLV
jgi:signal transduction histidine kinase